MTYILVSSAKKLLGKSMYIFIVHTLNDSLHSNYNYMTEWALVTVYLDQLLLQKNHDQAWS